MRKTTLYLLRHGEPALEFQGRYLGHLDAPLSERGEKQSLATADRLSGVPFIAIYASDLQRAGFLADALAERLDLPVRRVSVFRERKMGILQGLTEEEFASKHPEEFNLWKADMVSYRLEGAETLEELQQRIVPEVQTLLRAFEGGRIALVAHAGPIRVTLAHALGLPLGNVMRIVLDYASVSVIEFSDEDQARVKMING